MTDVAIVGAGMGGLALALALKKRGIASRVCEQAPALSEVGAGIMMTPNACAALRDIGAYEGVLARSQRPARTCYRDWRTGETITEVVFDPRFEDRFGAPFLTLHRGDLQAALLDACAAAGVSVELGMQATGATPSGSGTTVAFASGTSIEAAAVVACDGVRSPIRASLVSQAPARFTGNIAFRGMAPVAGLSAHAQRPDTEIWIGPGKHVVAYTVKQGALMNYVAISERDGWAEEGWSIPASREAALAEFDGWHPEFLEMIQHTPADGCFQWGLFDREPLETWTAGAVVLLGDAAHPTLPFMAQGAAMAFEDAVVLARRIAAAGPTEAAMHSFQEARLDRTSWVQLRSRDFGHIYHTMTDPQELLSARSSANERLYHYDAAVVPLD